MKGNQFTNELSLEIYEHTYKYGDETIETTQRRVAEDISSVEKDRELWTNKFLEILEDFKFVPGGRIISNAGTKIRGTTYINCFVDGFVGKHQDSVSGILEALRRQAFILKSEGGYGFCADVMRPRGGYIEGIANDTPGAVKWLDNWNTQSDVITAGSGRRSDNKKAKQKIRKGAQMVTMSCWHPDIEEFITAKQTPGRLDKFNMSVLIADDFMNAVIANQKWDLIFPDFDKAKEVYNETWDGNLKKWVEEGHPVKIYKTFKDANELWDLIMKSTYNRNEPGVLFVDTMNRLNNLSYCEYINSTNPCLAGDTIIAVADGRMNVSIKQLAEEGKDVPVYCLDEKGNLSIKIMRNPRITGYDQQIYKINIENGHSIRVTGNHKFRLRNGEYVEAKDLKPGDSLHLLTKYEASIKEIFPGANSRSSDYYWLNNGDFKVNKSEHRFIYDNLIGKIGEGNVIHHKDFNSLNNSIDNLLEMNKKDHDEYHSKDMLGEKNPYHKMSDEWKLNFASHKGETNSKYINITNEELKNHGINLTKKLNRRFSNKEWMEYAKEHNLPQQFSNFRRSELGSVIEFSKKISSEIKIDEKLISMDPRLVKTYNKALDDGYNVKIENNEVYVEKTCETCGEEFWTKYFTREISFCSIKCSTQYLNTNEEIKNKRKISSDKYYNNNSKLNKVKQLNVFTELRMNLKRDPFVKEWEDECSNKNIPHRLNTKRGFKNFSELKENAEVYNHRVISVELDNIENVYNGTVDQYHNFFSGEFKEFTKSGKNKYLYINQMQCGEQILPIGGVCLLGNLNLTQFIKEDLSGWDYDKLKEIIPTAIRFMDNVNDLTYVPLEDQKQNLKNKRRIGLGILGYGSALLIMKKRYGSPEALKITEELMSFIANTAYQSSALLAEEKGAFLLYDTDKYSKSNYLKVLSKETKDLIKKHGIRNSHLLSIQPTGNSSILANVASGGLEPVFLFEYVRTVIQPYAPDGLALPQNVDWINQTFTGNQNWKWIKEGDENMLKIEFNGDVYKYDRGRGILKESVVKDYGVRFLEERGEWDNSADWASNINNLKIEEHINTMKTISKYIDSSMSKTINLPNDYKYEDFKHVYIDLYKSGTIKGGTTYRAGTMATVIKKKEEDAVSIPQENNAPKRPKVLDCDVIRFTNKGEKWIGFIGIKDNEPYEIFTGFAESFVVPSWVERGQIRKEKVKNKDGVLVSRYDFVYVDREGYEVIMTGLNRAFQREYWNIGKMTSALLRHRIHLPSVINIIESLNLDGDVMGTWKKGMIRMLRKYVKEDKNDGVATCDNCGSTNLLFKENCVSCLDCNWQKCE